MTSDDSDVSAVRASKPSSVVVIGSANADLVVAVDHRPARGETILGGELTLHPGGKGANQAVAAARLTDGPASGVTVHFVGRVGADPYAALLRESLSSSGVQLDHLGTAEDSASGVALITVTPDGENSIIVAPGANGRLTAADVAGIAELARAGSVLVVQLEIPPEVVVAAADLVSGTPARLIVNAAPARDLPAAVLAAADPLVVNETEAEFYLGTTLSEPGPDLASQLRGLGAASVVVTLGSRGAFVVSGGGEEDAALVAAVPAEVVDTTGAGDSFVAAVAVELARGAELLDAVRFAVQVAAISVSREGAQSSFPTRAELG